MIKITPPFHSLLTLSHPGTISRVLVFVLCSLPGFPHAAEPQFGDIPDLVTVSVGEVLNLPISALDPDDDATIVTVGDLPDWMEVVRTTELQRNLVDTLSIDSAQYMNKIYDVASDGFGNLFIVGRNTNSHISLFKVNVDEGLVKEIPLPRKNGTSDRNFVASLPDGSLYISMLEPYRVSQDSSELSYYIHFYKLTPYGSLDFISTEEGFWPVDMQADSAGNLFIMSQMRPIVGSGACLGANFRKMKPNGEMEFFSGRKAPSADIGTLTRSFKEGTGSEARFGCGRYFIIDGQDDLYVDHGNGLARVSPQAEATSLPLVNSGSSRIWGMDEHGFYFLRSFAVNLTFISHTGNYQPLAGQGDASPFGDSRDGRGLSALFQQIESAHFMPDRSIVVVTSAANPDDPFKDDFQFRRIRFHTEKITGIAENKDVGIWPATLSVTDGDNTVFKTVNIEVIAARDLGGETLYDLSLTEGGTVENATLGGVVSGNASTPALLRNITILPETTLENVIIGEGVELQADTRLVNVKFHDDAVLPAGLALDGSIDFRSNSRSAYGGLPLLDLNDSVLLNAVPLIEQIRDINSDFSHEGTIEIDDEGHLLYRDGATRFLYEPFWLDQGFASGEGGSGIEYILEWTVLNTTLGRSIWLRPVVHDIDAMASLLWKQGLLLAYDYVGVHYGVSARSFLPVVAVRPDAMSAPARVGLEEGIHALPHPAFPAVPYYLFAYRDGDVMWEQALYPAVFSPYVFDVALAGEGMTRQATSPQGVLSVSEASGGKIRLLPSPLLRQAFQPPGLYQAGDLNGDGLEDYRFVQRTPYPVYQNLYRVNQ